MKAGERPLIVHVIHKLDVGGMENGLVNLINHMPPDRYRHAIVCLTDSTNFRGRIRRDDVPCYSLHKKPGQDWGVYVRLWRLLRRLRPDVVHTRNLATVEAVVPAALAGVRCRIHGEHGRDVQDIDGTVRKYRLLRRAMAPFVHRFVALSSDLASYLRDAVGVRASKITQIINGVDTEKFRPVDSDRAELSPSSKLAASGAFVVGTITRMQSVKDPLNLAHAFTILIRECDVPPVKLVMVGDGPEREKVQELLRREGVDEHVWLAGARDDVAELYRTFDLFALSSRVEGISNTILEAMASGLPVVATRVGGNHELVVDGRTGALVPPESPEALAERLSRYLSEPETMKEHGRAGRVRVEENFTIDGMVERYTAVYDSVLTDAGVGVSTAVNEGSTSACAG